MAEKQAQARPEAGKGVDTPAPEKKKKKSGPKVMIIVAGLMLVEAAGLFVVFKLANPASTQAQVETHNVEPDESELSEEILIADDKFQNLQTGRVWVWDTAVYVRVKSADAATVEAILDRRAAEVNEGVSQIISRAQIAQLKEPERQTLNRQLAAFLERILVAKDGRPLFERVLIPKCRGFPADY
jgi:flagellar basal body-associated protein FliL